MDSFGAELVKILWRNKKILKFVILNQLNMMLKSILNENTSSLLSNKSMNVCSFELQQSK